MSESEEKIIFGKTKFELTFGCSKPTGMFPEYFHTSGDVPSSQDLEVEPPGARPPEFQF